MIRMNASYARLKKDDINKLQALEDEIGKVVVAFEPVSIYAELSEVELRRVQAVEKELGVIILAYKS